MDNQDSPLPGVTVRVEGTTRQAVVDAEGQFLITDVPVGPVHLIVDGSTALADGEFPSLGYNFVTVAGANNPMAAPVYMVKLDTENAVYAGLQNVEVTLPEVPGFKLEIPAGSVTFPDGSKEGFVSVTAVNAAKVPMVPPNGIQPQLVVTIQPTGAVFDPPAPLTIPNVEGHLPGTQIELYSFDHDLEEFVSIGLGTVTEDGSLIESNPGVGIVKAGWHTAPPPTGAGCLSRPPNSCLRVNVLCTGWELVPSRIGTTLPPEEQHSHNDCRVDICAAQGLPGWVPADETPENSCNLCSEGNEVKKGLESVEARVNNEPANTTVDIGEQFTYSVDVGENTCASISYKWMFGVVDPITNEEATSNTSSGSHSYNEVGIYNIEVEVSCSECGEIVFIDTVTVSVVNRAEREQEIRDKFEEIRGHEEIQAIENEFGELTLTIDSSRNTEYDESNVNINENSLELYYEVDKDATSAAYEETLPFDELTFEEFNAAVDAFEEELPGCFQFTLERVLAHESFHKSQDNIPDAQLLFYKDFYEMQNQGLTNRFMFENYGEPYRVENPGLTGNCN